MKSALIFAFLFFSAVVLTHFEPHHNCIHDEIAAKFTPREEPHTEGRILLNGIEDEKKPFRVFFDTAALDTVGTQEQRDFIKNDLLPLAARFFETRFTIRRRTSPIKMPWDTCYQAKVTNPEQKTVGVDTDLLIYVTAGNFNEGFTAWATACMSDQVNGRPIIGQVNYNLNYLGMKPEEFEANLGTTLHEITHILGFSSHGFTRFINPDTGKALPRDQLVESISFRGFQTTILKTPKVVELARRHYGCQTIKGVEMENQGGGGSLGSHFERAILMNEAMTASRITNRAYSKFTMAVLEDSGWYYPNYNLSDEFFFGEGAGCDMFENGCQAASKPREYCYSQQGAYCTLDFYAKGYCGSEGFSDNCMYVNGWGNGDCRDPKNGGSSAATGELYGPTSKCITGTLIANGYRASTSESSRCVQYQCQNGKVTISLVGGKTATCESDGQKLTVDGYSGYLNCPPAKFFCETYYEACPNYCSGKGKCIEGKCMCRPGRTGNDCSQLTGCANNCNGNGACQPTGLCQCNAGWTGAACETKAAADPCTGINCGANGVCRAGECICNAGFTGRACNEVNDPCRGVNCNNGQCQSGRCVCNSGWSGVVCNQQVVPANPCQGKNCGNGSCRDGKCICNSGWSGEACNVQANPCQGINCGNGVCRNGQCVCNSGWSGANCNVQAVDPCAGIVCQNGRCSQGRCICNTGFSGTRCEIRSSTTPTVSCPNNCSGKGLCSAGKCYCTYPAYGADCSTVYEQGCVDNSCSGNGICFKKKCYCNSNFTGDNCQTKI